MGKKKALVIQHLRGIFGKGNLKSVPGGSQRGFPLSHRHLWFLGTSWLSQSPHLLSQLRGKVPEGSQQHRWEVLSLEKSQALDSPVGISNLLILWRWGSSRTCSRVLCPHPAPVGSHFWDFCLLQESDPRDFPLPDSNKTCFTKRLFLSFIHPEKAGFFFHLKKTTSL